MMHPTFVFYFYKDTREIWTSSSYSAESELDFNWEGDLTIKDM